MPTLCELSATPCPGGLDGRALGALLSAAAPPARALLADTWRYDRAGGLVHAESAAFDGDSKVLYEPRTGSWSRIEASPSGEQRTPIAPTLGLPSVRALAAYIETEPGPF
jgi:hypothetical protein